MAQEVLGEVTAGERGRKRAMDAAARLGVSYILVYITRRPSTTEICPHQVYIVHTLIPVDQIHALLFGLQLLRPTEKIVGGQVKYNKIGPTL